MAVASSCLNVATTLRPVMSQSLRESSVLSIAYHTHNTIVYLSPNCSSRSAVRPLQPCSQSTSWRWCAWPITRVVTGSTWCRSVQFSSFRLLWTQLKRPRLTGYKSVDLMTAFTVRTSSARVEPTGSVSVRVQVCISVAGPSWLLRPVREAEYCDERIRLSASLSQESCQFFACYGRRSVLHWCRCGTLCTSGFVDDATFAHRGQEPATGWGCMLRTTQQMAARIWLRGLYSSWPILVRQHRTTDRLRYLWLPCLCMLPMALARSSSGSVAIRHLLPVLWMTQCSCVLATRKRLVLKWLNGRKQNEFDTAAVYTQTDPPGGIVWYLRRRCCDAVRYKGMFENALLVLSHAWRELYTVDHASCFQWPWKRRAKRRARLRVRTPELAIIFTNRN